MGPAVCVNRSGDCRNLMKKVGPQVIKAAKCCMPEKQLEKRFCSEV